MDQAQQGRLDMARYAWPNNARCAAAGPSNELFWRPAVSTTKKGVSPFQREMLLKLLNCGGTIRRDQQSNFLNTLHQLDDQGLVEFTRGKEEDTRDDTWQLTPLGRSTAEILKSQT
jgi:hypothetical protein